MTEANGLDMETVPHLRDSMAELIKLVEGFFACGVAASVYGVEDPCGSWMPEPVFSNVGKLLLATQIYDMHRIAHEVSGGSDRGLPGPDEDHNPATSGDLASCWLGAPDIPYDQRAAGGPFHGGHYRLINRRLVLCDQFARGRLASGDEARDLSALPHRGAARLVERCWIAALQRPALPARQADKSSQANAVQPAASLRLCQRVALKTESIAAPRAA